MYVKGNAIASILTVLLLVVYSCLYLSKSNANICEITYLKFHAFIYTNSKYDRTNKTKPSTIYQKVSHKKIFR